MKLTTIPKRPTMAGAIASKHIAQAKDCARMVSFYHDHGDAKSVERWRKVWAEKMEDAKQIANDVWRAQ